MKKIATIGIVFILCLLLTGCGDKYKFYSNYNEKEVFDLVNSYISDEMNETGKYNFKIIKTEPLKVCTFEWNVCNENKTVKGVNKYIVELTNKTTGRRESQVVVTDKYYKNSEIITPNVFSENFVLNREYYERYDQLIALLNKYNSIKYTLIDDETKTDETKIVQYGYIYSESTSDLEDFLNTIVKTHYDYDYHWDFIITNDINEYNILINSKHSFDDILEQYEKTNVGLHVDLSSFNSNSNVLIENTSQGGSPCLNSILIKK